MSEEIKSALEIAMERASRLGKLTSQEAKEIKWVPEGERVAGLLLQDKADLTEALKAVEPASAPLFLKGLVAVLVANLGLPRTDRDKDIIAKVTKALRSLCADQRALDGLLERVKYVQDQYAGFGRQQLQSAYQELKKQFLEAVRQRLQQQKVQGSVTVDVESSPEFQSQWRAVVSNMEQQYEGHLVDLRQQVRDLVLAKPRLR